MGVVLENKYRGIVDKKVDYAVNNIVYVRGTKQGYEKVKYLYDSHL